VHHCFSVNRGNSRLDFRAAVIEAWTKFAKTLGGERHTPQLARCDHPKWLTVPVISKPLVLAADILPSLIMKCVDMSAGISLE
jgi:hypothetical protein